MVMFGWNLSHLATNLNLIFLKKKYLLFDRGAYYLDDLQGFNYQENVKHYEESDDDFKKVSSLTLVSNMELGIKVQDVSYTDDCMIDANMIGMMSKTGIPDSTGSHTVTGASVLNQMMIKSKRITKGYSKYCS